MVIDKAESEIDVGPELLERVFETFRHRDRANRSDERAAQAIEHQPLASVNILQIKRAMRALDNFGSPIVTADALDELVVRFTGVLGDENVARPPQIPRGL